MTEETLLNYLAIDFQELDLIKLLLANPQLDPNIPDSSGIRPLYRAIEVQNREALSLFLNNEKTDLDGALELALNLGFEQIAMQMVASGRKLNLEKHAYWREFSSSATPLSFALFKRNFLMAELLLKHGANPFSALYGYRGLLKTADTGKIDAFLSFLPT